jgi:hypothetical protein
MKGENMLKLEFVPTQERMMALPYYSVSLRGTIEENITPRMSTVYEIRALLGARIPVPERVPRAREEAWKIGKDSINEALYGDLREPLLTLKRMTYGSEAYNVVNDIWSKLYER